MTCAYVPIYYIRLRRLQYLGFAQISSFVSHLWTLFIGGVKTLLYTLHPCNKLANILLVTGPLRQGTLQLTVGLDLRVQQSQITQRSGNDGFLSAVTWSRKLTFCTGSKRRAERPRNLLGPEFVSGLQALPRLRCFSELTLLWWSAS